MALAKKMMIVSILEILKKYSDQNHCLTQKDIIGYLKTDYSMDADRKAIRRNLTNLLEAGYSINYKETTRSKSNGEEETMLTDWYLDREFTEPELRLLIDGILFSNHIPQNQCKDLIEKLKGLSSNYFNAKVSHVSNLPDNKPVDKELFFTIETLNDAISEKKKVAFHYVDYGPDKQLHERKKGDEVVRYIFNPYQMAASNGRYYLIGNHDAHKNVSHLRVDRIRKIEISEEPAKAMERVEGLKNGLDLPKHMAEHVYMFTGETVRAKFLAPQWMMNDLIDWFGMDVQVTVPRVTEPKADKASGAPEQEKCGSTPKNRMLSVTVRMNRQAMLYWAMQYGCHIEVLEPADLREELKQTAVSMAERYGGIVSRNI